MALAQFLVLCQLRGPRVGSVPRSLFRVTWTRSVCSGNPVVYGMELRVGHILHLSSHIPNPHVILKFLDGTKALKEATLSSRVGVPWDLVLCLLVALKKIFLNLGCGSATMNTLAL